jgi:hypothetical protein
MSPHSSFDALLKEMEYPIVLTSLEERLFSPLEDLSGEVVYILHQAPEVREASRHRHARTRKQHEIAIAMRFNEFDRQVGPSRD